MALIGMCGCRDFDETIERQHWQKQLDRALGVQWRGVAIKIMKFIHVTLIAVVAICLLQACDGTQSYNHKVEILQCESEMIHAAPCARVEVYYGTESSGPSGNTAVDVPSPMIIQFAQVKNASPSFSPLRTIMNTRKPRVQYYIDDVSIEADPGSVVFFDATAFDYTVVQDVQWPFSQLDQPESMAEFANVMVEEARLCTQ